MTKLLDVLKGLRRHRETTGRAPVAIRLHPLMIEEIYPRTSIRGDYFSLFGIPLQLRSDCPPDTLYFVSDEDFRVEQTPEK